MTAAVQAPLAHLEHAFKSLDFNSRYANAQKRQLSDEEKRKRIYETSYEPSPEWWAANQADYVKPKDDPLPAGFPEKVVSASVWDGKKLINEPEKWLYTFTASDLAEIEAAYKHFSSLDISNDEISATTFPLSPDTSLGKALKQAKVEINKGLGLKVLRGLPVDLWDRNKQLVIFAGISAYIGGRRIKQGKQNVVHLRDITNLAEDKRPVITVKGQTSGNQVFHNDGSAGIIALITLGVAETGGLSQLSSVGRTYNELAATRRDIVREIAKDDWVNKVYPEGTSLIFPVNDHEIISSYSRRPYFGFYEANADVSPLPIEKHLALDAIHFTAEKFSLDLDLQKGDLEYFNNLTVYHARTSSADSEENQRHLVRIWLENKGQQVPSELVDIFDRLNAGEARGWPLEAWDSVDPYVSLEKAK